MSDRPLALVVDASVCGSVEWFAAALAETGRAKVFGQPTQGFAVETASFELPGGRLVATFATTTLETTHGQRMLASDTSTMVAKRLTDKPTGEGSFPSFCRLKRRPRRHSRAMSGNSCCSPTSCRLQLNGRRTCRSPSTMQEQTQVSSSASHDSTLGPLLARARAGDTAARDELFTRCRAYLNLVARTQVESWMRTRSMRPIWSRSRCWRPIAVLTGLKEQRKGSGWPGCGKSSPTIRMTSSASSGPRSGGALAKSLWTRATTPRASFTILRHRRKPRARF